MYRACIAALLLLGYHALGAPTQDATKIPTFAERIAKIFGAKCLKNAGQLEYKELVDELNHVKKCAVFSFEPPLLGDELGNRCQVYSENVTQCLNKFVRNLQYCLDPKEKYLLQFITDVYNTSAKDFCDYTQMLSALKPVTATLHADTVKCVKKFKENPEKDPHLVCFRNSTLIGDSPQISIITKEEVCADIARADLCFGKLLDEQCPESPKVREYQRHFTKAGLQHCTDVST